jgi:tyrosine-protein kinase Etk/Wzc
MANISVIQSAMVPVKPVKPNKPLITLAGLVIGLLTGIGLSITREYLEGGYTRPEQLGRDLSLPILATVVLRR